MPASTCSSVRPASGTWKTYCGWPAANPPSTACARQPSSAAARPPGRRRGCARWGPGRRGGVTAASAMPALTVAASQRRVTTGRAHPDAEGAAALEVGGQRAQPAGEVRVVPVDDRALGQVGEVALHLRQLPVEHQAGARPARRRGTSRATRAATRPSPDPRPGSAGSSRQAGGAGSRGARRRRCRVRRAGWCGSAESRVEASERPEPVDQLLARIRSTRSVWIRASCSAGRGGWRRTPTRGPARTGP